LIFILLFLFIFSGQIGKAQISSQGRDFWVGLMENVNSADQTLEIYLLSSENANVQLTSSFGAYSNVKSLTPGRASLVILPRELMSQAEGVSDKSIHITSDKDISVFALNKKSESADATAVLPIEALGTFYVAMAHAEPNLIDGSSGSGLLIIATEDNTDLEIIPSANTLNGWAAQESRSITLNTGEVYDLRSNEDLTGTIIRTADNGEDKPFAVFGGSKFTNVSDCGLMQDHLYEQVMPVLALGKKYLNAPLINRNGGDMIKIVAPFDATTIKIDGRPDISLNAGEFFTIKDFSMASYIEGSKPILVSLLSKSSDCDNSLGDPFLMNLAPLEQRVRTLNFTAFNATQIQQYYVAIVATDCNNGRIYLDGNDVTDQLSTIENGRYGTIQVNSGDHQITSDEGVLAYVYGYGRREGYGYLVGMGFEDFDMQISLNDEVLGATEELVCVNAEVEFSANYDPNVIGQGNLNSFIWDFGDGTTGSGQTTTHTYATGGNYDVILYAEDSSESCGASTITIQKRISVQDVVFGEISGAQSVCEFSEDIVYTVEGSSENTYQWQIEGGIITSADNTQEITVNWQGQNDNAKIELVAFNALGCSSLVKIYPIRVNNQLEPPAPSSNEAYATEACVNSGRVYEYFTPVTSGSVYQWFTNGNGQILGSSNGPSVEVIWTGAGTGELWYTENNVDLADCGGVSDTLLVQVYEELQIKETLTKPSCFGDADGRITLEIVGGKQGIHTIEWEDGLTGGLEVSGLTAGQYSVTVTDEIGCEIVKVINLEEPEVLAVQDIIAQAPLCFQEDNGQVQVLINGGTSDANGNYRYEWSGNGINAITSEGFLNGLRPGNYEVAVSDVNDCLLNLTFEIEQTTKLEADLVTLINTPICPNTSEGTAFVDAKGGTPDYQFYWSNAPTVDDPNASNLSKGDYTVRIVDANGCETSLTITKEERLPKVFIPNAFSPNGDNINDSFKPVAECAVNYNMQVYNKWGSVVFSTTNITEGWDGTFQGKQVQAGEYSYLIFFAGLMNETAIEQTYRGSFKLIR
ncbi:MAG TPA: gliding motility-associated C-terminal domain-containing protein, partial [Roseivirga sp.]